MNPRALLALGVVTGAIGFFMYKVDADARTGVTDAGFDDPGMATSAQFGTFMIVIGIILVIGSIFILSSKRATPAPQTTGTLAAPPVAGDRQPCPRCGESIPVAAKVCRFCGHKELGPVADDSH